MGKLTDALGDLFPTISPDAALKTPSGATGARSKAPTPQDGEANYLPLICLGLGAALVVWAMLRPGPLLGNAVQTRGPYQPESEQEERAQSCDENWGLLAQE